MFPHRFDFIVGERKAAGGRYWIRSQKFGEAPVYYIHFKGEPVKVAPQVLDGRLGAIPFPTTINGFLHLVGSQLFIRLVHIRWTMLERWTEGRTIGFTQLRGLLFFPEVKKLLKGDLGPVNIPRITVVFSKHDVPGFTGFSIADDVIDGMAFVIPTYGFLHDVRAAALAW